MAPELLSQKGYGLKVDVWSIGVITFMLLSGQMFINCRNQDATKKRIQEKDSEKERL